MDRRKMAPEKVQLWYAPLPSPLGRIAVHHWFVIAGFAGRERWEVWQSRNAGGTSWGHVHRDLLAPEAPVGGGDPVLEQEWTGAPARALATLLRAPLAYPFRERYLAWPGPNSNTYAAWVLGRAGIGYRLDPRALGKDWIGWAGVRRCPVSGSLLLECPLLGVRLGDGWELHVLGLTVGADRARGELLTPFGRRPLRRTASPEGSGR